MPRAYYNEHDPKAAAWLRELISEGHIASGDVDERDIQEVKGIDLDGYEQCHFFAGIGGWSLALRLAGVADDAPIWTGSCPCQPFSAAGKRKGTKDERHLWPEFGRLIAECRPAITFGEQVASKDGREWLAGVRADLEALGYEVGAADLCAASVGSPHIRQRLWWMANASGAEFDRRQAGRGRLRKPLHTPNRRKSRRLANSEGEGQPRSQHTGTLGEETSERPRLFGVGRHSEGGGVGNATSDGRQQSPAGSSRPQYDIGGPGEDFWGRTWFKCSDGKARRVEPSIQPLAYGIPGRVGLLRGAGNAICPEAAAEFIQAGLEAIA